MKGNDQIDVTNGNMINFKRMDKSSWEGIFLRDIIKEDKAAQD